MIPLLLGVLDSAKLGHLDAHVLLQSQSVGAGGAASITFSSIPQGYRALQLRGIVRPQSSTSPPYNLFFRMNGDSGANYARHILDGNGASATSTAAASQTYGSGPYTDGSSTLANVFSVMVMDLLDYASTSKDKTTRALGGWDANGSGNVDLASSVWMSAAPVTSITLYTGSLANFDQYSRVDLYGIV